MCLFGGQPSAAPVAAPAAPSAPSLADVTPESDVFGIGIGDRRKGSLNAPFGAQYTGGGTYAPQPVGGTPEKVAWSGSYKYDPRDPQQHPGNLSDPRRFDAEDAAKKRAGYGHVSLSGARSPFSEPR